MKKGEFIKSVQFVSLLLFLLSIQECSSLLYSPSLVLSDKPLTEGKADVVAGAVALPETNPSIYGETIKYGYQVMLGYGFSDAVDAHLAHLGEFVPSSFSSFRSGYSLQSRIRPDARENSQFEFVPRFSILFSSSSAKSYGFDVPFIYLKRFNTNTYMYLGTGPFFGIENFTQLFDTNLAHVYGLICHIAMGYNFAPSLRIMGEVNPILQENDFNRTFRFILAPSISAAFLFGRKQNI